jgi:hypothetical protein
MMTRWHRYRGVVWRVAILVAVLHAGVAFGMIPPGVTDVSLESGEALTPEHPTILVEGHTLRRLMNASEVTVEDVATGREIPVTVPASNCERKVHESQWRCDGYTGCEREIPPGGLEYDCRFEVRLERLPPEGHDVWFHFLDGTWRVPTRDGPPQGSDAGE